METFASYIRNNTRIKGFKYGEHEKKIGLVVDDCLLYLEASVDNLFFYIVVYVTLQQSLV